MFYKINNLLGGIKARFGIKRQLEASEVCGLFSKVIENYFPRELLQHTRPVSYKNKILFISALNSVIASEINFKKMEIIEKINQELKTDAVKEIKFKI